MFERLQSNPYKSKVAIIYIFLFYYILVLLFQIEIIPSIPIQKGDMAFPAFQTTQFLIVFPLVLIIIYLTFIRNDIIKWHELGFNKGKDSLKYTISLGLLGGLIIATFNYLTIEPFYLEDNIVPLFFEKCVFAPIWEEFYFRVLLVTFLEFASILLINKYYFDNPKYKGQYTESKKKWLIREIYVLIICVNAIMFIFGHGLYHSTWIFTSGVIMATVYLKTRSIIAPIIVHSMHNFVTGGFLFLIINWISG
ncbi:CAAX protease self-immunity [Thermoplasmatales archaeon SCGC AB-540-F20]|nr:CAAX protease self-immunity [Thermoplasmatales archaeon SCGC AB-540-F20]